MLTPIYGKTKSLAKNFSEKQSLLCSINVSWVNCIAIGIIQLESGNCVANGECVIYLLLITWRLGNRVANG